MKKQIFTKGKIKIGILFFAILLMVAGFSYLQNVNSTQAQGGSCVGGATDPNCWSTIAPTALTWGPMGVITNAQSITNGAANTATLAGLDGDYPAADYCYNLTEGGFSDWYLPAEQELLDGITNQFVTPGGMVTGFRYNTTIGLYLTFFSSTEKSADRVSSVGFSSFYGQVGFEDYEKIFPVEVEHLNRLTRCLRNPSIVTFDSQSATVSASPITKKIILPETTVVTLPTAPTKTGYTFGGWYTAVNGGGTAFTATTPVSDDVTVYARWLGGNVTFDSQGATVPANPATKTVTIPATTVVTLPTAPTKTGYTFGGWYTAVNGGGNAFTATTPVTANITVYAKWGPPCTSGATDPSCQQPLRLS